MDLISEAKKELARAKEKHDWFSLTELEKVAILANEAGEALQAAVKWKKDASQDAKVKAELIQTTAMCMRVWEELGFGEVEEKERHPYASHPYIRNLEPGESYEEYGTVSKEAWNKLGEGMFRAIGEQMAKDIDPWVEDESHVTIDGVRFEAVNDSWCLDCELDRCYVGEKVTCGDAVRADKRNVVWKRVG